RAAVKTNETATATAPAPPLREALPIYNSSTHPATAVVNGVGGDSNLSPAATLEYFSGSTAGPAGTGTTTAPTNAGTYTVRASFAADGHNDQPPAVKTIVCEQATATVAI